MKAKLLALSALGSLLAFLVAAVMPASAENMEDRIKALENELGRLKSEQIEMKKQATEAEAALPTFSHRAGSGLSINAADKSWGMKFLNRFNTWTLFRAGKSHVRAGDGELFVRRFRPEFWFCLNNCFWELEYDLDEDGFGTNSEIQRGAIYIHLEQLNPWLPTFNFGEDVGQPWARRRSSSSGVYMLDYDMLSRSNGFNTGSTTWSYVLLWEDKPLTSIGIPGKLNWFSFTAGAGPATSGDGQGRYSNHKDYVLSFAVEPFSEVKSKWISGLEYSFGVWFCNTDHNGREVTDPNSGEDDSPEGCQEARIRETDGPERANIWRHRTQAERQGSPQNNMNHFIQNSLRWRVGVYEMLATLGFQRYEGSPVRHRNWNIGHQIYVWSPKGFLTGSSSTAGSVAIGTHFERSDGDASSSLNPDNWCRDGICRNHAILTGANLFYVIQRGTRVGFVWNHYDAKKLASSVQEDLNIGNDTSWNNFFLIFDWNF